MFPLSKCENTFECTTYCYLEGGGGAKTSLFTHCIITLGLAIVLSITFLKCWVI
jgi:hypothetical protein